MDVRNSILKTPEHSSFAAALSAGVITHSFALFNIIYNYDNLAQLHGGFGTGIPSGRWFLEIMKFFCEWLKLDYNLPVINGLLLVLMLALSAGFAVSAFGIKKHWTAALIGILFVVFPTVTSTMLFRYTAFPYGLGILFSIIAAWILPKKGGLLLSGLFTAMSLGIYQAYTPVTITIFVMQLIVMALKEDSDFWAVVRQGLYRCASLLVGIAIYYVLLKLFLIVFQQELNNYRGMQNMGKISLAAMPGLIRRAYIDFVTMPFRNYCGLSNTVLLTASYVLLALVSGFMVLLPLIRRKKISTVILTGGLCILLPLAANFVIIMCPEAGVYTLMVYSFVLVPCFPLVLLGQDPDCYDITPVRLKALLCKVIASITILIALLYGYYANVNYTAQYYATRQTENYANTIVAQARMTPGFTPEKKWVFVGSNQDPLHLFIWEDGMIYGGSASTMGLIHSYSIGDWFWVHLGFGYPYSTEEEKAEIIATDEVKAMPCWPSYGSMQVVGDYLVIKFQEVPQ